MSTDWISPTTITQYAEVENHVPWKDSGTGFFEAMYPDEVFLETTVPLLHIANSLMNDIKNKTFYLQLTGFNIINLPTNPIGIEVEVSMKRDGRITDETVQLTYNNQLIGNNKADGTLDLYKIYGSNNDLWNANLTAAMIGDPSFGIVLRYQSHPSWPHRSTPMLDYIRLRVY
jgi:hypothetical protein